MREGITDRLEDFCRSLEEALGGRNAQSAAILAEVRADLEAQARASIRAGTAPDRAWTDALDSMGNPHELGQRMRQELPPPPPRRALLAIRYALAGVVIAWALLVFWMLRSFDYGADPWLTLGVVSMHLPVVLLLWPGLVWRWNALFSSAAAAAGVLLVAWLAVGGMRSESSTHIALAELPHDGGPASAPIVPEPSEQEALSMRGVLLGGFGAASLVLWSMLQQRRQRRHVLACTLAGIALVEVPHQVEEWLFRREARSAAAFAAEQRERTGSYPSDEEFRAEYQPLYLGRIHYRRIEPREQGQEPTFQLSWSRTLQRNHGLGYDSDGTFWGHD